MEENQSHNIVYVSCLRTCLTNAVKAPGAPGVAKSDGYSFIHSSRRLHILYIILAPLKIKYTREITNLI